MKTVLFSAHIKRTQPRHDRSDIGDTRCAIDNDSDDATWILPTVGAAGDNISKSCANDADNKSSDSVAKSRFTAIAGAYSAALADNERREEKCKASRHSNKPRLLLRTKTHYSALKQSKTSVRTIPALLVTVARVTSMTRSRSVA